MNSYIQITLESLICVAIIFLIPLIALVCTLINRLLAHKQTKEPPAEWEYSESLMNKSLHEALPIIDDAMTNGFEFKLENNKLYYRETTKHNKKFKLFS